MNLTLDNFDLNLIRYIETWIMNLSLVFLKNHYFNWSLSLNKCFHPACIFSLVITITLENVDTSGQHIMSLVTNWDTVNLSTNSLVSWRIAFPQKHRFLKINNSLMIFVLIHKIYLSGVPCQLFPRTSDRKCFVNLFLSWILVSFSYLARWCKTKMFSEHFLTESQSK